MQRRSLAAALAIFAINALLCGRLWLVEYTSQLGSVDGSFISMARYIRDHGDVAWWPLWFCGVPFQNVYGPGLHVFVALVSAAAHISPAHAYHATLALFYCLGAVTFFWMALRFSGSLAGAFSAALLWSLVSPAALLLPGVRADIGGAFYLRRLYNLAVYGEAPHIIALCIMPLALIALDRAIRTRRPLFCALAALAMAAIVLVNVTGAVGFAMLALSFLLARPVAEYRRAFTTAGLCALLGYGLAIPWVPPTTIGAIAFNSQFSQGNRFPFTPSHILYFAMIAAGAALLRWGAGKRLPGIAQFGLLLMYFSAVLALSYRWTGIAILPQPERFQLEFELGCALVLGYALGQVRHAAPRVLLAAGAAALLIYNVPRANALFRPIDMTQTIEYQAARWFGENMHGSRVFAPGSVSLWMNVFTDTPQLGGCCDQSVPDWEQRVALYTLYTGQNTGARDGEVSLLWLQAYGVHAVEVTGPHGRESYKPFQNPHKFDGLLPVLWRDGEPNGDDAIYRVPQPSPSLARVMRPGQLVSRPPRDGLDIEQLRTYVAAFNDRANLVWSSARTASATLQMQPTEVLSVQVSYDPGWQARANGAPCPITRDGLGLMALDPHCDGRCVIDLTYYGTTERRLAKGVQVIAALVWLLLALLPRRRPRVQSGVMPPA